MKLTATAASYSVAPSYAGPLTHTIGALQHFQALLPSEATLVEVQDLLLSLQDRFGAHTSLEDTIQALVGQHLLCQLDARKLREVVVS